MNLWGNYLESRKTWYSRLWPAAPFGVGIFYVLFFLICRQEIRAMGAITWSAICAGLVAIFLLTPSTLIFRWADISSQKRSVFAALLCYVVTVAIGNFTDLRSIRGFFEILTFTGGAPVSEVHAVAILGAIIFYASAYKPKPVEPAKDILIRGPVLISEEEAVKRAKEDTLRKNGPYLLFGVIPISIFVERSTSSGSARQEVERLSRSVYFCRVSSRSSKRIPSGVPSSTMPSVTFCPF